MKNLTLIILLGLTVLTGCDLEEDIFDSATPESYIKNVEDMEIAMYGVYSRLNQIAGFGREAMWLVHSSADDLSSTAPNEPGIIARKTSLTSGFALYNNLWNNHYNGIANANGILDYLDIVDLDENYEARIRSEALFLRAFWYFNLVQLYGGVPLITETLDASEYESFFQTRNTVDEVYEQIFADLQSAIENLPTKSVMPQDEAGRASRQAAQGYLAKAYLTYANYLDLSNEGGSTQYYQLSENWADSVILSGEHSLLDDYAALWDVNQENIHDQEVLFKVVNTRDETNPGNSGEGGFMVRFFAPNSLNGTTGQPNTRGIGFYKVQPWFFEKYLNAPYENDYRAETSFLSSWTDFNGRNRTVYPLPVTDLSEPQAYISKYFDGGGNAAFSHENDFFLLRMSDIYLMKAEAENELNGPTLEAQNAFNMLRERARIAGGQQRSTPSNINALSMSKEEFRLAIFDERGLEFVAEYSRYFDLKRMRYTDNTSSMYEHQYEDFLPSLTQGLPNWNANTSSWTGGITEATNVVPYNVRYELYPIPANERLKNPSLTQNPNW